MTQSVAKLVLIPVFTLVVCFGGSVDAQETAFKNAVKKSNPAKADPKKGEKELTEILVQLEMIFDVTFAYQKKFLSGKFAVYRPLIQTSLDSYLDEILPPQNLGFKKIGNADEEIYVIFPQEESIPVSTPVDFLTDQKTASTPPTTRIQGFVKDRQSDSALSGVNVIVQGTSLGTITDANGSFTIDVPVDTKGKLTFSYIGFVRKELEISYDEPVQVLLEEEIECLPEVVVTALGIQRNQKAIGYAVSTIETEDLVSSGNTNFASALYGKIPGVRVRTAPGGATSAVTIQIRGFNSLNYNTQPLYIVDGIPIREANEKGVAGINNDGYFTDQRLRGNGLLDISPSDIETLTALKGASATALYGSDASNGAVVITTKRGMKRVGMGVEINYNFAVEKVAFTPHYQNIYGPGYDRATNVAVGATAEGWVPVDTDNDGATDAIRPLFRSYGQFGPKMEGQEVLWWDGSTREYSPQPDNYNDFYRTGYNSLFNVALQNQVGIASYRLSYTRNDYEGIQVGGKLMKNIVNLNSMFRFTRKFRADWMLNYTNSSVHNRPYKINRITDSYNGFFSRAEKMSMFFDKYQTSEGYKWVPYEESERNPEEALKYSTPRGYEVMNLLWRQLKDSEDEIQNRLISSFTLNYDLTKNIQLRGRLGNDITDLDIETKQHSEYPTIFNGASSTGSYGKSKGRYSILYADALVTFSRNINPDFTIGLNGGFQIRDEEYSDKSKSTSGGLKEENVFSFSNSYNPELIETNSEVSILKYAYLGIVSASYKNMLFIEGTGRQEYSSTLPPDHNDYFYPSVNTGFVFSEAVQLPAFFNYGKLRASYGVVGNAPPVYEANILYTSTTLPTVNGPIVSGSPSGSLYGNSGIRPERKYEVELGLEARFLKNRLGVDFTYYDNRIKDQILKLDLPTSTGASKVLANVGQLKGHGVEVGLSAAILTAKLKWNAISNVAFATTKVTDLMHGVDQLVFRELEGGSIRVVAEKGQSIGNVYVYPRKTDDDGNLIINTDGLYVIDKTKYVKVGNLLPKATGGVSNSFMFKNLSLNLMIDYSLGGNIISPSQKYAIGSGMYESTLQYRDEANGGLPYNIVGGIKVLASSHANARFHDGVMLKGVTEEGIENTQIIEAATYYLNTFAWGNDSWNEQGAIFDNSYIKVREAVLSYTLPKSVSDKLHFQKIQVSLVGRNLFYVWRTMKDLDPESTIGTTWLNQGIDDGSNAATRSYGFALKLNF